MRRILLTGFCALPGPNRAGVQMSYTMDALKRHHSVDALVIRHGEQAYVERRGGARILRVPLHDNDPGARIDAFRRALRRQLEGADYDIAHFRDGWAGALVLDSRAHFGYRTIFDVTRAPMSEPPELDAGLGARLRRAERRCLEEADHVLAPTHEVRTHLLRQGARSVHVVPTGVDIDLFDWDYPEPGPPTVLYAGTVEPGRGIRVLLRAMAYLVRDVEARLMIVGAIEPTFRYMLEQQAQQLGIEEFVELHGEVEHRTMPELIASATVCVAPSAPDPDAQSYAIFPTKILEYMACRRAVVAARGGSTTQLMEHSGGGALCRPGDPSDLARQLRSLIRDRDRRGRLAETGYQYVRRYHTASAVRRSLRRFYREVAFDTGTHAANYHEDVTNRRPAAPPAVHDPHDITETNRVNGYPPDRLGARTAQVRPAANRYPASQDSQSELEDTHDAWGHETDETVLPPVAEVVSKDQDDWVVSEWDDTRRWRSLLDTDDEQGTPITGVRLPTAPNLTENRFVAGEIDVDTPVPHAGLDEPPSFTAVSILLGPTADDDSERDKP